MMLTMTTKNFKEKKFALFATIAVVSAVLGVVQFDESIAQEQQTNPKFTIVNEPRTAEMFLSQDGIKSAISVTTNEKHLMLGSDNSVSTTLQISHE